MSKKLHARIETTIGIAPNGEIYIEQEDEYAALHRVFIHPNDIPVLIEWLQELIANQD